MKKTERKTKRSALSPTQANPYVRSVAITPACLEGGVFRRAYDTRLFYALDGEGELLLRGDKIALSKDAFVLLRPKTAYCFAGNVALAVVDFDVTQKFRHRVPSSLTARAEEADLSQVLDKTALQGWEKPFAAAADADARKLLITLAEEFYADQPLRDAVCSSLLKQFLALVSRKPEQEADFEYSLFKKLRGAVRLRADSLVSNTDISDDVGYHPVYLNKICKKFCGKTLHAVLSDEKVALSCQYLSKTEYSIEEIALRCGFSSRSAYCTAFKSTTGHTPLAYREKNRK